MFKKNIVLITIDALRARHLSCLGYNRKTTSHIDRLAEKGVLFSQAFASGPTTPFSFPAIMASVFPLILSGIGLPKDKLKTIAEVFKDYDYATAAWHPNAFISGAYNYHRGFDLFMDPETWSSKREKIKSGISTLTKRWPKIQHFGRTINNKLFGKSFDFTQKCAEEILNASKQWLSENKKPFFIWMHFNDVHHPWFPREEFLSRFSGRMISPKKAKALVNKLRKDPDNIWENISKNEIQEIFNLYDSAIAYTDEMIGRFLDSYIDLMDTTVVITSDHGEEFGEHSGFHRVKPYDEMLHVPLIMAGNDLPRGGLVDKPVSLIDLAPTLVSLCGFHEVDPFLGKSLLPVIKGTEGSRIVISEYNRRLLDGESFEGETYVIRKEGWKFILREKGKELYHLESDPGEKRNLLTEKPEVANSMEAILSQHISQLNKKKITVEEVELNETLKQNLRGLGYLD